MAISSSTTPVGDALGKNDYIGQITGGVVGAWTWTWTWTAPTNGIAVFNNNPVSSTYGVSYSYNIELPLWVQIGGPGTIGAGTALQYSGTTLNVQTGAGITVSNNALTTNLLSAGGLFTTIDGTTASSASNAQVSLTKTGITAGLYNIVTVDAYGRVTSGSNPTTLAGHNITDAVNASALGAPNGVATLDIAGKLSNAQIPTFTGDVSGTSTLTLATVATAGTYRSVTVNAKGLVTAGTNPTTLAGYGITDAVTSVNLAVPGEFSVSGNPITTSGTMTITKATQTANTIFAGPTTGVAQQPTFRTISLASNDVSDVVVTTPTNGNLLQYNGTNWVNQTTIPGAYTTVISSWTLLSGNRYYADVTHNLGTSNIVISTFNNATNAMVQVDSIVISSINVIRVTVVGNTVAVRLTAVANGLTVGSVLTNVANSLQVINAGGTVSIQEDLLSNRPAAGVSGRIFLTTDTKTLYRDNGTSWDVISAGTSGTLTTTSYYSSSVDSPVTADFAINGLAPAISDPINTSMDVRSFSNTVEQGIAMLTTPPTGAVSMTITTTGRAETAPVSAAVVQPRMYFRAIPNGAAFGAWSAPTDLAVINIPTNAFYKTDTQTFTLSSLGLAAGVTYQLEVTRNIAPTSGTNLAYPWYMTVITVAYS